MVRFRRSMPICARWGPLVLVLDLVAFGTGSCSNIVGLVLDLVAFGTGSCSNGTGSCSIENCTPLACQTLFRTLVLDLVAFGTGSCSTMRPFGTGSCSNSTGSCSITSILVLDLVAKLLTLRPYPQCKTLCAAPKMHTNISHIVFNRDVIFP